ncbi:MAG: TGS domain-containing protein, partial [Phycisphaerae bacterium]
MAQITLPDGKVLNVDDGFKAGQVVEKIGKRLAQDALAVKINGQLADLDTPVAGQIALHVITNNSKEGLEIIRHSCAHVMAEAICSLWPKAELVYGPTIDDGFYYDIDLDEPIRPEDF